MREDSAVAMQLKPTDGQRIVRALEVLDASGRSILEWQAARGRPLIDRDSAQFLVIEPDRAALVERIETRFDRMLDLGALDEVKRPCGAWPRSRPAGDEGDRRSRTRRLRWRATSSFPEAIERCKIATRQYAKRQTTWFRHQLGPEWRRLQPGDGMRNRDLISCC